MNSYMDISLQSLVDFHQGMVWAKDMQGRFVLANQAFADFFNLTVNDVIGKTDYDFHSKEKADLYRKQDYQIYETQSSFIVEEEIQYDGRMITTETLKSPFYNSKNGLVGTIGFNRDITKVKELELQNKKLLKAIEQSSANFVITDLNGNIEYVNPQFTRTTGYMFQEVIGKNPKILKSGFTPVETYKSLWKSIRSGNEWHGEFCNRKKNGELFWESVVVFPVSDENGCVTNFVAVKEDITVVMKTANELIRLSSLQDLLVKLSLQNINVLSSDFEATIYHSMAEICKIIEADRTLIFNYNWAENTCCCIYEWHHKELNSIKDELSAISLDTIRPWVEHHKHQENYIISDVNHCDVESAKILKKRGIKSIITVPVYIDNQCKGFISFDSILRNHSCSEKESKLLQVYGQLYASLIQRFELEQSLKREMQKAQAANDAKSEFLANMSHELRTPLNGVIGFSELLMEAKLDKVQLQYTTAINKSAKSLLNIINDILDFSKIEAGKLELDIVKTDVVQLIDNVIDIVKHSAEKKGLEILVNIPENLARFAYVDSIRISQILVNLLNNAVKFTDKGEVELKVTFEVLTNEKCKYTFNVRDTGIGITDKQKLNLFKAFTQADTSTTRVFGGTGLGLSIAQKLAQKMDSQIVFESVVNQGSVFGFSIVVDYEMDGTLFKEKINQLNRVLLIEDNHSSRTCIQRMLNNWGLEVVTCESASEAIFILQMSNPYDLIIVDNSLHTISGIESIQHICRKLNITVESQNFLLLHASTDDYYFHHDCEQVGIKYMIEKPLRYDEVFGYLSAINIQTRNMLTERAEKAEQISTVPIHKILVVDDDMFNMMLAKAMIDRIVPGVEIVEAKNGKVAFEKVIEQDFDLVFMDVQMPEMDGNEATMAIREYESKLQKHTPIVGLTAGALLEERNKCFSAGMDDFLTKPIESDRLSETIKRILKL